MAWLLMLLAMMPPLLAPQFLHVWRRSLTRRRIRAVTLFLLGYLILWFLAGAVLTLGSLVLASVALIAAVPPLVLAALISLFWQATPLKQMSLQSLPSQTATCRIRLSCGSGCVSLWRGTRRLVRRLVLGSHATTACSRRRVALAGDGRGDVHADCRAHPHVERGRMGRRMAAPRPAGASGINDDLDGVLLVRRAGGSALMQRVLIVATRRFPTEDGA